jgi:hypothetical protein
MPVDPIDNPREKYTVTVLFANMKDAQRGRCRTEGATTYRRNLVPQTTADTVTNPAGAGVSFWVLLGAGLVLMLGGNFVGRFLSTRTGRVVTRKLYYMLTIPLMIIFVVAVFLFGGRLTMEGQYALFGGYILAFSILGGFVEAPRMSNVPRYGGRGGLEPGMKTGDTVDAESRDVTTDAGDTEASQSDGQDSAQSADQDTTQSPGQDPVSVDGDKDSPVQDRHP